jgi:GntR family transcriptional regulator
MFIRIQKGSVVPISRQIAGQIRALCSADTLKPGQQLPSVRQLARDLGVNQNTVLRVYEQLTAAGLLEMKHGRGTFVAARMPRNELRDQRRRFTEEWNQLIRQGRMLGMSHDELHQLLDTTLSEPLDNGNPAPEQGSKS